MEFTLDYIDNILLDTENPPIHNYQALEFLSRGIVELASLVRAKELKFIEDHKINVDRQSIYIGGTTQEEKRDRSLVTCEFHWFGLSLANFARLIKVIDVATKNGWKIADIKANKQTIKTECTAYLKEVIPEIYIWRNKVLAHFAITDPYADDNLALLEASVMNLTIFTRGRYYFGELQYVNPVTDESSDLPSWSLTETFEKIIPRYFPKVTGWK